MTGLRRGLLLVAVTLATVLTLNVAPAHAAFTADAAARATVGTITVQPVTRLSTAGSSCNPDGSLELRLSWTKSTTERISSYRIRTSTLFGYITLPIGSVAADRNSFVTQLSRNDLGYSFSVTTTTDYGWTAESAQTGTIRC